MANFLDVEDLGTFPQAFVEGRIGGEHAAQHTSDLVRFPLLLRYGGVYAVSCPGVLLRVFADVC